MRGEEMAMKKDAKQATVLSDPFTEQALWLEVANVRVSSGADTGIWVQFRGERVESQRNWWRFAPLSQSAKEADVFKAISESLDKRRPVYGCIGIVDGRLMVTDMAVDYSRQEAS